MNSYDNIMERFVSFANQSDLIQAMVLFGSRAREHQVADQYSDYDIIVLVKDVDYFLNTNQWLNQIGKYHISFQEQTVAHGKERRVFYNDAMDMDLLFYDVKQAECLAADKMIQSFFSRGFKMLVDKINFEGIIQRSKPLTVSNKKRFLSD